MKPWRMHSDNKTDPTIGVAAKKDALCARVEAERELGHDRQATLHVSRADTPHQVAVAPGGAVAVDRNGVGVAGDEQPHRQVGLGAPHRRRRAEQAGRATADDADVETRHAGVSAFLRTVKVTSNSPFCSARPWGAEPNQRAARTTVPTLLCPENTPQGPPGSPALTCYVGVGGVGANAAALPAGAPKAGAMRYDTPTPFERVTDGLGQTLLLGETRSAVGPWLRGGPATVRGLDDAPGAPALIGAGGQFGGYFPGAANFAMCDGSVRVFTGRTDPSVLRALATIAGKGADPVPGD